MFRTSRTYPWSFGTQIFHNGQPGYGGDSKTVPMLSIGKCKKMYIDS